VVVEQHIATNLAHAALAQFAQQQPETLQRQGRIAAALQYQVAAQNAIGDRSIGIDSGLEGMRRPQGIERRQRGDQFHHRGRVQ
jgi:hypothetical protein